MGTIQIDGSTPKLTIGNATAEDATILFDGNAQDFYIALDDSADDLLIGLGSTVGTTPIIAIDENKLSTFSGAITVGVDDTGHDVKFFGATASAYMLWDESADDLILAGAAGLSVAGATATAAITASGIIKTDATTAATSTTDGSLQTYGGLSVVLDAVIGDDLYMLSDASVIHFGADSEITLTHVHNAGLILGGTTPTLTIGDAGAEDAKIVFDGNAQDFHIGLDDSADDLVIGLGSALGTTTHIAIDEAGVVRMPLQPAFIVYPASEQSDMGTGDNTVAWGTELLDVNADFASNTFTAPVDGLYQFNFTITIGNLDVSATYINFHLSASNEVYRCSQSDLSKDYSADTNEYNGWSSAAAMYMDANDTVTVIINIGGSGSQMDVVHGSSSNLTSHWSGYLVA